MFRMSTHEERVLAVMEVEHGHYLDLTRLMHLIADSRPLLQIMQDYIENFSEARGSSHNHQAWEGGYVEHVVETMNIACQQYVWMRRARKLPFSLSEALEVMFLHDLEKPFKAGKILTFCQCKYGADCKCPAVEATKENRKKWRNDLIAKYGVKLNADQENALRFVEGVPDNEYTPGERTMGELAAFCHSCDILSARLWYDRGHLVPAPHWE